MACISRDEIIPLITKDCNRADLAIGDTLVLIYKATVLLSWVAEVTAVILLIYAALLYFTSPGDESRAATAKKIIIGVVVGILIILLARWILYIVTSNIAVSPPSIDIDTLTEPPTSDD